MPETLTSEPIIIDLWVWSLTPPPAGAARLAAHLSGDERTRAARFLDPAHGAQFTAGRGRLREILATYTGASPDTLQFHYGAAGKPQLTGTSAAPAFNLSHTGDLAALAVTPAHPLGIDIEAVRPLKEDIAERFFSTAEVRALQAHPPSERMAAFTRCWTRKEAFVKATGDGLGFPLDAFDVSIGTGQPPAIQRIAGQNPAEVALWRLLHINPAPGIIGAIALRTASTDTPVTLKVCR